MGDVPFILSWQYSNSNQNRTKVNMLNGRNWCTHCKPQISVLALKMAGRGWVKYSPIYESNSAPSIRANIVQLTRTDLDPRAAMGPSVGWNSLLIGLFGLNCAQMTPGKAESDFSLQGWIGTSELKQIFSFSLNLQWRNSETFFTRVGTISNEVVLLEPKENSLSL